MGNPSTSLSRREFLKGAAALAAAGASGLACDASLPGGDLRLERVEVAAPGLHPAHDGLRVAQLSDVHLGVFTPPALVRAAVEAANAFAPDLVALTGDFVTRYHVVRRNSDPRLVAERLGGLRAPAVAVLGNHDWYVDGPAVAAALEGLGYAVLRNEHTSITLRGERLTVVGVDDLATRHADVRRAARGVPAGSRLCLAHVPETALGLRASGFPALVLSGHTHGGQLDFPPFSARFTYKAGLYPLGPVSLYVNRGLGNSWCPVRVNAPPEVTLFTLRAGAGTRAGAAPGPRPPAG